MGDNLLFGLGKEDLTNTIDEIYIYDSLSDEYHDLKTQDFSININSNNSGIGRFELRFLLK